MWKTMPKEQKDKYFEIARMVDAEHKKKYPGESNCSTCYISAY